jgi:hypothetical protein
MKTWRIDADRDDPRIHRIAGHGCDGLHCSEPPRATFRGGYQFAAGEPNNGIRRDGAKGDFGVKYTW